MNNQVTKTNPCPESDPCAEIEIISLPIAKIRANRQAQPRVELDQALIDEYAEAMREGVKFPPVVVFVRGEIPWLSDGFHRYHAAIKAGQETIDAKVLKGSLRDAILHSVGANASHGLRRTNRDKRRAVCTLLRDEEWSQWSNREIARRAAVSESFVRVVQKELALHQEKTDTLRMQAEESREIESLGHKPSAHKTQMRKVSRQGAMYEMHTGRIGADQRKSSQDKEFGLQNGHDSPTGGSDGHSRGKKANGGLKATPVSGAEVASPSLEAEANSIFSRLELALDRASTQEGCEAIENISARLEQKFGDLAVKAGNKSNSLKGANRSAPGSPTGRVKKRWGREAITECALRNGAVPEPVD